MHKALQCLQKGLSPNRSEHGKTNQTQFVVVRCVSASPSQDSGLAYIKPGFVDITCCDSTLFREWHSDRFFRAIDLLLQTHRRVEAGTFTKTDYEEMEMSTGLDRSAAGLLASPTLRSRGRRKTRHLTLLSTGYRSSGRTSTCESRRDRLTTSGHTSTCGV